MVFISSISTEPLCVGLFLAFCTKLTSSIQKNIIMNLKLDYPIVSNKIAPITGHKNHVSLLSILVLHCLISCIPLNLPNFIIKHMLLPRVPPPHYPTLEHCCCYFLSFASIAQNEPSKSSSKPFDKSIQTKPIV